MEEVREEHAPNAADTPLGLLDPTATFVAPPLEQPDMNSVISRTRSEFVDLSGLVEQISAIEDKWRALAGGGWRELPHAKAAFSCKAFNEGLTQIVIKLDSLDVGGILELRASRKAQMHRVEAMTKEIGRFTAFIDGVAAPAPVGGQDMLVEPNAAAAAADGAGVQDLAQALALAQTQAAPPAAAPQSLAAAVPMNTSDGQTRLSVTDMALQKATRESQEMDRAIHQMEQEDGEVGDAGKSGIPARRKQRAKHAHTSPRTISPSQVPHVPHRPL